MIYELATFYGRKPVNDMMHAADVFTPNRALVEQYDVLEVTVNADTAEGDGTLSEVEMKRIINKRKTDLEKSGMGVTAIFFRGHTGGCFIDNTIQTISTGEHWCLLEVALRAYGCPVAYEYKGAKRRMLPVTSNGNKTTKPKMKVTT